MSSFTSSVVPDFFSTLCTVSNRLYSEYLFAWRRRVLLTGTSMQPVILPFARMLSAVMMVRSARY